MAFASSALGERVVKELVQPHRYNAATITENEFLVKPLRMSLPQSPMMADSLTETLSKETNVQVQDYGGEASEAPEICGEPDEGTLQMLSAPCQTDAGHGNNISEPGGLSIIATSRGQKYFPRKYKLPPFRLYVCHPNATRLGFLVSQSGVVSITTREQMDKVASDLLNNRLWGLKQSTFKKLYAHYKVHIKKSRPDKNVPLLWVLDRDGNLLIAPEVQSTVHKHGDLTPGQSPVDGPEQKVEDKDVFIGLTCCCKEIQAGGQCNEYYRSEAGNDAHSYCCKLRIGGCPTMSHYHAIEGKCGVLPNELVELYTEGKFRGMARAGGEIRYPDDGSLPVVQDKSGYSFSRVDPDLMKTGGRYDSKKLGSAPEAAPLGLCAMRRLRDYWSEHLKWPVMNLSFAAVSFEGKLEKHTFA